MLSYLRRFIDFLGKNNINVIFITNSFCVVMGLSGVFIPFVNKNNSQIQKAATVLTALAAFSLLMAYLTKRSRAKSNNRKQALNKKHRDLLLYLAAFLIPAKDRDFEIGNMLEIYHKDKKRFGQKRALKLLAFDVIKSVYPLIKRAISVIVRTVLKTLRLYRISKAFWG